MLDQSRPLGRHWLVLPLTLFLLARPAFSGAIALGTWGEFGFSAAGTPATGCDPNDPAGPFCVPSSGTPTTFLDAPAWTFTAPATGALLTVTDAFEAGDRFEVFDFGASLGLTSLPFGSADCGDDPVPCLATAGISSRVFTLGSGAHSIRITPTLSPISGGAGYLLATAAAAIPEPATLLLLGCGMTALIFARKRSR